MPKRTPRCAAIHAITIHIMAPTRGEGEGIAPNAHPVGAVADGGATQDPVDVQTYGDMQSRIEVQLVRHKLLVSSQT
jgi:hypothetical protein